MQSRRRGWVALIATLVAPLLIGMSSSCTDSERDYATAPPAGASGEPAGGSEGSSDGGDTPGVAGALPIGGGVGEGGGAGAPVVAEGGGSGETSSSCAPKAKRCAGNGVQVCEESGEWGKASACAAETPSCNGAGVCGQPPSCIGMTELCGAGAGDSPFQNCCASRAVPGGTFNRSNDDDYPATVSGFRLDVFEVSVGRFENFVIAYERDMIPAGAGKNPNDANDAGWNLDWNTELPLNANALKAELACDAKYQTFSLGFGEYPVNCVRWHVANAFCAWDGGRLPTEAEWNYAASGGDEQRPYPWGTSAPTPVTRTAAYRCGVGCPDGTSTVGYADAGSGRWGHFDLAGNVAEWTLDWYTNPYAQATCSDCANLSGAKDKSLRGGSFWSDAQAVSTTEREPSFAQDFRTGIRCARAL